MHKLVKKLTFCRAPVIQSSHLKRTQCNDDNEYYWYYCSIVRTHSYRTDIIYKTGTSTVPYYGTVPLLEYRTAEIFFYAVVSTIVHGRDRYDFSRRLVTVPYGTD